MNELKVFNKWSTEGIKIHDPGLIDYISLESRVVPKTGARYAGFRFRKSKVFIIERLINKLMVSGHKSKKHFKTSGHMTGKANTTASIVEKVLKQIQIKTKENPMKVLVNAIVNAAPREEIVTIEYGGARYPKGVECAPQRRIDVALRYMVQGAYHKSFNTKISMVAALTDEIISAFNLSNNSNAISKKLEVERQADASR